MSPETDGEFFRRKWGLGGLGFLIVVYGVFSIFTTSSHEAVFIFFERPPFLEVEGPIAVGSGIQYIGIGMLLISYFFLPYTRLAHNHVTVQRIGWILTIVGYLLTLLLFLGFYEPSKL